MYSQPCTLSQIQEREADIRVLAELSRALDKKVTFVDTIPCVLGFLTAIYLSLPKSYGKFTIDPRNLQQVLMGIILTFCILSCYVLFSYCKTGDAIVIILSKPFLLNLR